MGARVIIYLKVLNFDGVSVCRVEVGLSLSAMLYCQGIASQTLLRKTCILTRKQVGKHLQ
jgi:hypothetical protein